MNWTKLRRFWIGMGDLLIMYWPEVSVTSWMTSWVVGAQDNAGRLRVATFPETLTDPGWVVGVAIRVASFFATWKSIT